MLHPSRYGTLSKSALHLKFPLWSKNKGTTHSAITVNPRCWSCKTKTKLLTLWHKKTEVFCPPEHSDARHVLSAVCLSHTQVTPAWPLLQTLWLGIVIAADLDQLVKINGGQRWIFSHGRDASWLSITRGKKKNLTLFQLTLWDPGVSFQCAVKSSSILSWLNRRLFSAAFTSTLQLHWIKNLECGFNWFEHSHFPRKEQNRLNYTIVLLSALYSVDRTSLMPAIVQSQAELIFPL